jgi:broad specificity phosphatase PhoE
MDGSGAPRTRLFLVRHCEVFNPRGVLYGHLPGYRLSERGIRQAHSLGRRLAAERVRQIYTSPLQRARETAAIIASYLPGVEVTTTEELVEASFGKYLEGVKPRDVIWRRPLWLIHMLRPGLLPRDETVAGMAERVQGPIDRLLRDHPGEGGVCISHGDPIQAFWVKADGRRDFGLHRLECMKGGMLALDYEGTRLVAKTYQPPAEVDEAELPDPPLPALPASTLVAADGALGPAPAPTTASSRSSSAGATPAATPSSPGGG